MYYFLTASKDATVYLQQPDQNTGLDEILEISKIFYGNIPDVSRPLLKFETGFLSSSLASGDIKLESAILILRETEAEEIPLEYTIEARPISGAWEMGIGTRFDDISTAGVTWAYREGDSKLEWTENGLATGSDAFDTDGEGGVWYSDISSSQEFKYQTSDIYMEVSNILRKWISGSIPNVSGSIPNDGLMLKFPKEFEKNSSDYGIIKIFSKETNTIYQPKILIGWEDQVFNTGSLSPLESADSIIITPTNFKKEYRAETISKIRLNGREKFPKRTITNQFPFKDIKFLPKESFYQIRDFESNDVIIPFSNYTKISCDEVGNFITINFSNWESNRVYKLEFKVDDGENINYFDDDYTFILSDK